MRGGFTNSISTNDHPLATGPLLSRIVQGPGVVSDQHIKLFIVYYDYEGNSKNEILVRCLAIFTGATQTSSSSSHSHSHKTPEHHPLNIRLSSK